MYIHVLIAFALLLTLMVAVVAALALQTKEFRVTRSINVAAPPAVVFSYFNDFHAWEVWSSWDKLDPNGRITYEEPASGPGAELSWEGNLEGTKKLVAGSVSILESRPNEFIRIKFEYQKPMKWTNTSEFTFQPEGARTHVNWTMYGPQVLMLKIFGLFVNIDKRFGRDLETRLVSMKELAEATR